MFYRPTDLSLLKAFYESTPSRVILVVLGLTQKGKRVKIIVGSYFKEQAISVLFFFAGKVFLTYQVDFFLVQWVFKYIHILLNTASGECEVLTNFFGI